jgi:glucan 1,3-beta-glucosidase
MSVQWTVASAIAHASIGRDQKRFHRTAKGASGDRSVGFAAFWETTLGGLLVAGAAIVSITNYDQIRANYFFAGALLVQSLPFLSAAMLAALEGSRLNKLCYWRRLEIRISRLLGVSRWSIGPRARRLRQRLAVCKMRPTARRNEHDGGKERDQQQDLVGHWNSTR